MAEDDMFSLRNVVKIFIPWLDYEPSNTGLLGPWYLTSPTNPNNSHCLLSGIPSLYVVDVPGVMRTLARGLDVPYGRVLVARSPRNVLRF